MKKQEIINWLDECEAVHAKFCGKMTYDELIRLETEIEVLEAVLK